MSRGRRTEHSGWRRDAASAADVTPWPSHVRHRPAGNRGDAMKLHLHHVGAAQVRRVCCFSQLRGRGPCWWRAPLHLHHHSISTITHSTCWDRHGQNGRPDGRTTSCDGIEDDGPRHRRRWTASKPCAAAPESPTGTARRAAVAPSHLHARKQAHISPHGPRVHLPAESRQRSCCVCTGTTSSSFPCAARPCFPGADR